MNTGGKFFAHLVLFFLVLAGRNANAQFSFNLPKLNGINVYFEPVVAWLPNGERGGFKNARDVGLGFGFETSFAAAPIKGSEKRPYLRPQDCRQLKDGVLLGPDNPLNPIQVFGQDKEGNECRVCFLDHPEDSTGDGKTAWGVPCTVKKPDEARSSRGIDLEIALGYAQRSSWNNSPLAVLKDGSNAIEVSGVIRSAPYAAAYVVFNNNRKVVAPYLGISLALTTITEYFKDTSATATTLTPGFHAGLTSDYNLYAEVAYDVSPFGAIEYKASRPSYAPNSMLIHAVSFRIGFYLHVQD